MSYYPSKRAPLDMGLQSARIFDFSAYDPDEHEEKYDGPDMSNVFAAAVFVAKLIREAGFQCALCGGCALVALGAPRKTFDADIATNAKMADLWRILDNPRVYLPDTKQIADTMRLFIQTGPEFNSPDYGDVVTEERVDVQVDVMVAGGFSVPRRIEEHIQRLSFDVGAVAVDLACLSTPWLLRAKLNAYSAREARKDFEDIKFLLDHFDISSEDLNDLDLTIKEDFVDSKLFHDLDEATQQGYTEKLQV